MIANDVLLMQIEPRLNEIRELQCRCGIQQDTNDDLIIAIGHAAVLHGHPNFESAMNTIRDQLQAMAATKH